MLAVSTRSASLQVLASTLQHHRVKLIQQLVEFDKHLAAVGCRRTRRFYRHSPDSCRVVRHLPRFRVLGNPAPLARAVDGDGTSRRHAER